MGRSLTRLAVAAVSATLVASGTVLLTVAPAEAAASVRLHQAIKDLPVASETRVGYERSKFSHWIDGNGDCQDTRAEVLRQESRIPVAGSCTVLRGKWKSYVDGETWKRASDVDVDHLVPLAEAWDSGAKNWNAATRKAYANDLGDKRTLVAITDNVNQSKGDRDPAQWLPELKRCTYIEQWVAVKIRWSLKVDKAEKKALQPTAEGCDNARITVEKAKIRKASSGGGAGSGTGGGTDPRYSYCYQAKDAGYGPYYQGRDPEYGWYTDADNDGVVCE